MAQNHHSNRNGVQYVDPEQSALKVVPLKTVPYTGPPLVPDDTLFPDEKNNNEGPAMVFLPCRPVEKEMKNLLSCSRGGVVLTGSAALGKVGPLIGLIDLGEAEDGYAFRVSLPGVLQGKNRYSCEVDPSGKVTIKGVTTTGEDKVTRHTLLFEMQTHNLCPPGQFSATFTLPGPVDHQTLAVSFSYGILVGEIKKKAGEVF